MSGGSWDYVSHHLEDVAMKLKSQACPYRRAMAHRLHLIAQALHEIEWVDSGDTSHPSEMPAIMKALGKDADAEAMAVIAAEAKETIGKLAEILKKVESKC
jgi:hypothetical protein